MLFLTPNTPLFLTYVVWGLVVSTYATLGRIWKTKLYLTAASYSIAFGVLLSLILSTMLQPMSATSRSLLLEISKVAAAIQIFVTVIYLPQHYILRRVKQLGTLVTMVMLTSAAIAFAFLVALFRSQYSISLLWFALQALLLVITDPVTMSELFKYVVLSRFPPEV
ncbi:hypothetical protein GEMRC1_008075 [Eukaryota sp. GEM-RC1]